VFYIDPTHEGTIPFFQQVLPTFNTLVGGFEGLFIQDSHLPSHINGEAYQKVTEETSKLKQ
jgi:hypothetical protein